MNSKTNNVGDHKVRSIAPIIAAALCLLLMLMSFALVNATSFTASAHHANKQSNALPADTGTITLSPTDTSTPSPTITPTPSPTTAPTPTPTPSPTTAPTPKPKPTSTPTSAPGATPTATTSQPTSTAQPGTTPTSSDNSQTPTAISGVPNTNTNNGNNGGNNNTPASPSGGGFSLSPGTISMGLLTLLGFGGALFVGLLLLRMRFLPSPVLQTSLPPSGAQPWKRVRIGSLNGITNTQSDWNNWPANIAWASGTPVQGSTPPMAPNRGYNTTTFSSPNNSAPLSYNNAFLATSGGPISVPNIANPQSRPFQAPSNNNSISPISIVEQPPFVAGVLPPQATQTTNGLHPRPINTNTDPLAEQVRPPVRHATRPIRLQNIRNAAPPAAQNPAP